ncbi:MAG: nicotinate phosphoribosyltransferase [Phototrophicales bacterium]|nr:MAG: nicotinate phosphoribosyltransferase [Phototrophicales bacterium]
MALFNNRRLTNQHIQLDIHGLRQGLYSDKYFTNIAHILGQLEHRGYYFDGDPVRGIDISATRNVRVGEITVEAQIFNRRAPYALVGGVDVALAMLRHATGYFVGDEFVPTWDKLEVHAVQDGSFTYYAGNPEQVLPVMQIRGRLRDFTLLETPMLGVLSRATRIATNVYDVLEVCNNKQVLFFPARFDWHQTQALDGYAYWLAIQTHNTLRGGELTPLISTDAQGLWWGGTGRGTIPHAYIACFFGDTAEAMRQFAKHMPLDTLRVALVDFNNDCVRDALRTLEVFWDEYRLALANGDEEAQKRYTLHGVRLDTSGNMLDASLSEGDGRGVSPALVHTVRRALDNAWTAWEHTLSPNMIEIAKNYCRAVKIVVSGGFNRERIEHFETNHVPVDYYGVGSSLFTNDKTTNTDFTMDVVRARVGDDWLNVAKVGRAPNDNPALEPVQLADFE